MPLRKSTLVTLSVVKALQTPLNLLAGAVAAGTTWWFHDPTWAIVYGAGAAGWVAIATATHRYRPRIQEDARRRREVKAEKEREAQRLKCQRMLDESPFDLWTRAGTLPDYMAVFGRLVEIRNRVARVLAERVDLDAFTKADILHQLGTMLTAYLGFVRERVSYLHILTNVRPVVIAPKSSNALPDWRKDWRRLSARLAPAFVPPMPSVEKRLAEVDEKTRQIRDLAAREPATARTREFHLGILQKQRELLLDCHKRDQCVVAQLGAFSDAFEVIHGRLSAAQFSATEVASYMSQLVEQIVETERFVETLRPSMDGLMGGLDSESVARPTAVRVGVSGGRF